jgi:hypothetical protein
MNLFRSNKEFMNEEREEILDRIECSAGEVKYEKNPSQELKLKYTLTLTHTIDKILFLKPSHHITIHNTASQPTI